MAIVTVVVTAERIDLMMETAVSTLALLYHGSILVEAMAMTASLYLLPHLGSHVILSCATSGVQMVMVDSVELVNQMNSVLTLEHTPVIIVMIRIVAVEAAECNGVSGM